MHHVHICSLHTTASLHAARLPHTIACCLCAGAPLHTACLPHTCNGSRRCPQCMSQLRCRRYAGPACRSVREVRMRWCTCACAHVPRACARLPHECFVRRPHVLRLCSAPCTPRHVQAVQFSTSAPSTGVLSCQGIWAELLCRSACVKPAFTCDQGATVAACHRRHGLT